MPHEGIGIDGCDGRWSWELNGFADEVCMRMGVGAGVPLLVEVRGRCLRLSLGESQRLLGSDEV